MMAELFGRVDGYCKARALDAHRRFRHRDARRTTASWPAGMPIACGAALAAQLEDAAAWRRASS